MISKSSSRITWRFLLFSRAFRKGLHFSKISFSSKITEISCSKSRLKVDLNTWLASFTDISRLSSYSPVSKTVRMWVTKKDDATVKQKQLWSFITINTFDYFGKVHPILTDFFHSDNHQCELDRWNSVPISIFFHRISDLNFVLKLPSVIDHESWSITYGP